MILQNKRETLYVINKLKKLFLIIFIIFLCIGIFIAINHIFTVGESGYYPNVSKFKDGSKYYISVADNTEKISCSYEQYKKIKIGFDYEFECKRNLITDNCYLIKILCESDDYN